MLRQELEMAIFRREEEMRSFENQLKNMDKKDKLSQEELNEYYDIEDEMNDLYWEIDELEWRLNELCED